MEPVIHTEIFKHLLPVYKKNEAEEAIRRIEAGLASGAEWWNDRIEFLTTSGRNVWNITLDCHERGSYKIPITKMRRIARLGLVEAWRKNIVTAAEIGAFADDVASLQQFSAIMMEAQIDGDLASVWEHSLDVPPGFTPVFVDIGEICRKEREKTGE